MLIVQVLDENFPSLTSYCLGKCNGKCCFNRVTNMVSVVVEG